MSLPPAHHPSHRLTHATHLDPHTSHTFLSPHPWPFPSSLPFNLAPTTLILPSLLHLASESPSTLHQQATTLPHPRQHLLKYLVSPRLRHHRYRSSTLATPHLLHPLHRQCKASSSPSSSSSFSSSSSSFASSSNTIIYTTGRSRLKQTEGEGNIVRHQVLAEISIRLKK